MGCDIHLFVECKQKNIWKTNTKILVYDWRNYVLFALLANVRNGDHNFKPISNPRGLPKDVTQKVQAQAVSWGADGHSHSFLTLQEILNYNWGKKYFCSGDISPKEYLIFKSRGKPENWYGFVRGTMEQISNKEMDEFCECLTLPEYKELFGDTLEPKQDKTKRVYTYVRWKEPYKNLVHVEWWNFVDKLKLLNKDYTKTRIVFWFDN